MSKAKSPTNQDLMDQVSKLSNQISKLTDFAMEKFENMADKIEGYRSEIVEFKDGVYDKMDAVYKEVLAFRDEEVMHQAGQVRLQDSVDDHEKRIHKLEKPHITAHQINK